MRVVEPPTKLPNLEPRRFRCKKCGALIEFMKGDIQPGRHDPDGEYVKCPCCGTLADVTDDAGH
jgi:NAD-dependent SIR2 family protein deacetylase